MYIFGKKETNDGSEMFAVNEYYDPLTQYYSSN